MHTAILSCRFLFTIPRLLLLSVLLTLSGQALAQANKNIYLYKGADREQKLIDGAKKEGALVLYSTTTVKDAAVITAAFEKKYGIKATHWRAGQDKLIQRVIQESRAGRYDVDIIETDAAHMEMLHREKLLEEFHSPAFVNLPAVAFPKHRRYVASRFAFFVMGYNTKLVAPQDVPTSYDDLLDPKWAGKLCIEATDVEWFAAIVKAMGEEKGLAYFRKLAAQKPQMRQSHILVAELVAAGELPIVLTAYNNNIETLKKKGAPVEWKPLPPTFGRTSSVGLHTRAPHPHAALLFADFLLSDEGQEIIKSLNRVPTSTKVDSPLNKFPYALTDPHTVLDEWNKWERLWSNLFLGGRKVESAE